MCSDGLVRIRATGLYPTGRGFKSLPEYQMKVISSFGSNNIRLRFSDGRPLRVSYCLDPLPPSQAAPDAVSFARVICKLPTFSFDWTILASSFGRFDGFLLGSVTTFINKKIIGGIISTSGLLVPFRPFEQEDLVGCVPVEYTRICISS